MGKRRYLSSPGAPALSSDSVAALRSSASFFTAAGLALAAEPAEKDAMQRPPRPPKQRIFTGPMLQRILWVGLLIGGVLKGQEMITNAKLKRIESDNAGIAAAMFSYQDRYLQLPGDDNDAENRFSTYSDSIKLTGSVHQIVR